MLRAHPCVAPSLLTPVPPGRPGSSTKRKLWRRLRRQRMATVAVDSSRTRMRSIGSEVRRAGGDDDYSANTCEAIPRGGARWPEEVKDIVRSVLLGMLSNQ